MKNLKILATTVLLVMLFTTLKAESENPTLLNSGKKNAKIESKTERKEIRKEKRNLVSDITKYAFSTDFGEIPDVTWETDQLYDEALFTMNGTKYKAFYDENSKLVCTTTDKTFADLPMNAQNEINKEYKDYTIDKVVYLEDNKFNDNNALMYGAQFQNEDVYFAELTNNTNGKNIVIQINPDGQVFFFKELHNRS